MAAGPGYLSGVQYPVRMKRSMPGIPPPMYQGTIVQVRLATMTDRTVRSGLCTRRNTHPEYGTLFPEMS